MTSLLCVSTGRLSDNSGTETKIEEDAATLIRSLGRRLGDLSERSQLSEGGGPSGSCYQRYPGSANEKIV